MSVGHACTRRGLAMAIILTGVSELAVEEARRGSQIWLGLGGDLHRRS